MTTFTTAPLAPLLQSLFQQAESARSPLAGQLALAERERLMRSKTDYLQLYGMLKDLWLPVSPETGRLLYMMARSASARHIVEFGTSFGISTLHLAAALRDNGGGLLITSEFELGKARRALEHLQQAGLDDLVELRVGDAMQTLATGLPANVDLLLLDGAKALYGDVLALVESRLRPGAFVIADNADYNPGYVAYVRDPANGYLSVPFGDDVEVSLRLA